MFIVHAHCFNATVFNHPNLIQHTVHNLPSIMPREFSHSRVGVDPKTHLNSLPSKNDKNFSTDHEEEKQPLLEEDHFNINTMNNYQPVSCCSSSNHASISTTCNQTRCKTSNNMSTSNISAATTTHLSIVRNKVVAAHDPQINPQLCSDSLTKHLTAEAHVIKEVSGGVFLYFFYLWLTTYFCFSSFTSTYFLFVFF